MDKKCSSPHKFDLAPSLLLVLYISALSRQFILKTCQLSLVVLVCLHCFPLLLPVHLFPFLRRAQSVFEASVPSLRLSQMMSSTDKEVP